MILFLHSTILPHPPPFCKMEETEEVFLALQLSHWIIYIHFNGITRHKMGSSSSWGFILCCKEPPSLTTCSNGSQCSSRGLGSSGLAGQPFPSQLSSSIQETAQPLYGVALEKGVMCSLPSSRVQTELLALHTLCSPRYHID